MASVWLCFFPPWVLTVSIMPSVTTPHMPAYTRPLRGTQASVRTQQPVPLWSPPCPLPAKLIDVFDVGKQGAHLLHVQPQGLAIHQRAQVVLWG